MALKAKRSGIVIKPDCKRVLLRPFNPTTAERSRRIIARIMALTEKEVVQELDRVVSEFDGRHQELRRFFLSRFEQISRHLLTDPPMSEERKLLMGAYFTHEYSVESAALFNPSMVWHPDQSNLKEGRRFILSLRATGEGHISSLTFRTGVIVANHMICMDEPGPFVTAPEVSNSAYNKAIFEQKLHALGLLNDFSIDILAGLGEIFTLTELRRLIETTLDNIHSRDDHQKMTADGILTLAFSNYEVKFSPVRHLSERIIFPTAPAEINGIEDARFVQFHDENGDITYYAPYTAFDGEAVLPQLLETMDFLHFKLYSLKGPAIANKNLALFPRKIDGRYAMLSRQDNENNYVMFSEQLYLWHYKTLLSEPAYPWEFVQIGNCGSPIETEAGWLVLSHGVGPMRRYTLGAFLLDLDDPTKVIGRLKYPLLSPDDNEREGYVPNVVYSCGGLIYEGELIIPYAMSDYASGFAMVNLEDLLNELTS